jgi:ribonuclease HII
LDELALRTKNESHKLKALESASVKAEAVEKTEIVLTYSEIFEQLPTQNQADSRAFKPSHIIVDGVHCPESPPAWLDVPMYALIEGDSKVAAISAASVLAKVARDRSCNELHRQYPDYGFNQHKGYGTALHAARLKQFGATPAHRKSFKPVRLVMGEIC